MKRAYFVSCNANKIAEVEHLFGRDSAIGILRHSVVEILDADLEQVIRAKVDEAYKAARQPVIVEHSAIYLEHLNGFPGALLKPLWEAVGARLCELVPANAPRRMRVGSAVCYCDGRRRRVFMETLEGELAAAPRGTGGYHWDTIFIPKGETRTVAELTQEEKLRISPAGCAYRSLRAELGL